MTWSYRILSYDLGKGTGYYLHEVFYDEAGNPTSWTEDPVEFSGETVEEIRAALAMAHYDTYRLPVLKLEDLEASS